MTEVKALDRYGRLGTIPEEDLPELEASGGRLATKDDLPKSLGSTLAAAGSAYVGALAAPMNLAGTIAKPVIAAAIGQLSPELAAKRAEQVQRARENDEVGQAALDGFDAGELGTVSGMTAGLGPGVTRAALGAVSPEAGKAYQQWATEAKEAHPSLYGAAEFAGMVGTSLASGGMTGLARATPMAVVGRAGLAAEGLAARATAGLGSGVLGRAAQAAAKYGAQGAAEGALQGAADFMGEQLLHDHELTAEKLYAAAGAAGNGALLGGIIGGVGGGGASLVASGGRATLGALSRVMKQSGALEHGAATTALQRAAGDEAFRAINGGSALTGGKKWTEAAAKIEGGTAAVGNEVLDRLGAQMKGKRVDELLPLISGELDKVGQQIGNIIDRSGAKVDLAKLYNGAVADAMQGLEKSVTGQKAMGAFNEAWDLVHKTLEARGSITAEGVAASELITVRRQLDDLIFQSKAHVATDSQKAMMGLRDAIEDTAVGAIEKEANAAGGSILKELGELKGSYRKLALARNAAEDNIARLQTNRQIGLTDYLSGGAGSKAGAFVGSALGPAGAAVGGFVGGAGGALLNKVVRERGNATAAVYLRQLSNSTAVANAARYVDNAIEGAAKGVLAPAQAEKAITRSRSVSAATGAVTGSPRERAQPHVERVTKAQADVVAFAERIAKDTEPLAAWAPGVAGQYANKATSAAAFLATKIPEPLTRDTFMGAQKPVITDADAHKFLRYQKAVDNPMSVFADMKRGVVTPEAVEALRATSPRLYQALRNKTLDAIADRMVQGKQIPYDRRIALSILLDIPGDRSLDPAYMVQLQGNVNSLPDPSQQGGGGGGPAPPKRQLNSTPQTSQLDRIESGQ